MKNSVPRKRFKAVSCIAVAATATGGASAVPTPVLEVAKQFSIGAADAAMCLKIWEIYFEEKLTVDNLKVHLSALGVITLLGAGTGYVAVKTAEGLMAEV